MIKNSWQNNLKQDNKVIETKPTQGNEDRFEVSKMVLLIDSFMQRFIKIGGIGVSQQYAEYSFLSLYKFCPCFAGLR